MPNNPGPGSPTIKSATVSYSPMPNTGQAPPSPYVNNTNTNNSSNANILVAGGGLDWFWETFGKDTTNKKAIDLLN